MAVDAYDLPILGTLPSHWSVSQFGSLLNGGTRNGIYKKKEFHGRGVKIVNMGELFAHPRMFSVDMKRVELTSSEMEKSCLSVGDLLFARRSLVAEGAGKCSIVLEVREPTTFESSIIRARPDHTKVESVYLYYLFNSPFGRHSLETIRRTVAVSGITGTDLVMLELPVPPLHEQRDIASILGSLDDKIELNRRMNETLEGIARALFKSWFVDFDPVSAKMDGRQPAGMSHEIANLFPSEFEHQNGRLVPTSWRIGTILDDAHLLSGGTPKTSVAEYWDGDIPWASAKDVSQCGHAFLLDTEKRITQNGLQESATKLIAPYSTVIVARGATTGRLTMFGQAIAMNQTCYALRSKFDAHLFLYCHARNFIAELVNSAHGSVFDTITTRTFETTPVLLPARNVALAFDAAVEGIFGRIRANLIEATTLATLRDVLLPKLLSGELRVPEANKMLEEVL